MMYECNKKNTEKGKKKQVTTLENEIDKALKNINKLNIYGDYLNIFETFEEKRNLARCHQLIKLHKPFQPMRFIISTINSPGYNLSTFLTKVLKNILPKS